jgi:ribosomal protein L10
MSKRLKKERYGKKLTSLLGKYDKIFMVKVDMVGSKHIQKVRKEIRGCGELLFGKNTLIRKVIRSHLSEFPKLEALIPYVDGNSGFLFIKEDVPKIRKILKDNFFGSAARSGVLAPIDVHIPAGVTPLQPTETSFFQALNIPTKISKGSIEILTDVHLVKKGHKVLPGQAALLQNWVSSHSHMDLKLCATMTMELCLMWPLLTLINLYLLQALQPVFNELQQFLSLPTMSPQPPFHTTLSMHTKMFFQFQWPLTTLSLLQKR